MPRQIDVAVNAPEAGIIKEFLANEEDTVVVGQDLVRIEVGGAPSGDKPAAESKEAPKEAPKEPAPETQTEQAKAPEPKPQETKPAAPPAKQEAPAPKQPSKPATAAAEGPATLGSRDERRVSCRRIHALRIAELTGSCRSR